MLFRSAGALQISISKEAMAIAKYFRGVSILMRDNEQEGEEDDE